MIVKFILIDLETVRSSGRLDFGFYNPAQEAEIRLAKGYTTDKLGNLCIKVKAGKTAPRGAYPPSGVRIIKVKNIRGNRINWSEKFFVTEEFYRSAEKKASLQEGDILMLCSAHSRSYIGRVDIIDRFPPEVRDDNDRCLCVGELIIIRADPSRVLPAYLITYLRLPAVQEKIQKMVKGQSAHLYPKDLMHLDVVLPPPEIQANLAEMNMNGEKEYFARLRRADEDLTEIRQLISRTILTGNILNEEPASDETPQLPLFTSADDDVADDEVEELIE